jgi:3-dehydroquinate synthase
MESIRQKFTVEFSYPVHFTERLFEIQNTLLADLISHDNSPAPRKILFVIDSGVAEAHPELAKQIEKYIKHYHLIFKWCDAPLIIPGGEDAKNEPDLVEYLLEAVDWMGLCRHSYLVAIGGGAVLDLAGFAASIAHRGIRHIRIPTTVLAQNDSGVGVKNGINAFGKKNFIGSFTPPYAVINDSHFLTTLEKRDWRAGIAEAIKVALIKDADLFRFIRSQAAQLNNRDMKTMQQLIYRCAALHLQHIASRDPFESGSSRPLDFGHWAAHKLEHLTNYTIRHGEAVAIGMALDTTYSYITGMLAKEEWEQVLDLLLDLGFSLYTTDLEQPAHDEDNSPTLMKGLEEFREHLGGRLTIMLLDRIGHGTEVNQMNTELLAEAVRMLKYYNAKSVTIAETVNAHS